MGPQATRTAPTAVNGPAQANQQPELQLPAVASPGASSSAPTERAYNAAADAGAQLEKLRGAVPDRETRERLERAFGANGLDIDRVSLLKTHVETLRLRMQTEPNSPQIQRQLLWEEKQLERATFELHGRSLLVSRRVDAFLSLVASGHVDLQKLHQLRSDPAKFQQALGELEQLASASPELMGHRIADPRRDQTRTVITTPPGGVARAHYETTWRSPTGVVRSDEYLRNPEPALPQTQLEPWQRDYLQVRAAQARFAQRLAPEDARQGLRLDRNAGLGQIVDGASRIESLTVQLDLESDPAKRTALERRLFAEKAQLSLQANRLAKRYDELGRHVDAGRVSLSGLTEQEQTNPAQYRARMAALDALMQLDPAAMHAKLSIPAREAGPAQTPRPQPAVGISPPPTRMEAEPSRPRSFSQSGEFFLSSRGESVNITLPRAADLPNYDPRMSPPRGLQDPREARADIVHRSRDAYRQLIVLTLGAGASTTPAAEQAFERQFAMVLSQFRGANSQQIVSGMGTAHIELTRSAAEQIFRGPEAKATFGAVRSEMAAFQAAKEKLLSDISGKTREETEQALKALRDESAGRIANHIRRHVRDLPGVAPSDNDIRELFYGDSAVKRSVAGAFEAAHLERLRNGVAGPGAAPPAAQPAPVAGPAPAPQRPATPPPTPEPQLRPTPPPAREIRTPETERVAPPAAPAPPNPARSTVPLATFRAEGATHLELRLPDGGLVIHNLTPYEQHGRRIGATDDSSKRLAQAGIRLEQSDRGDGTFDVFVHCATPGSFAITAKRGEKNVDVTTDGKGALTLDGWRTYRATVPEPVASSGAPRLEIVPGRETRPERAPAAVNLTDANRAPLALYYSRHATRLDLTINGRSYRHDLATGKTVDMTSGLEDHRILQNQGIRVTRRPTGYAGVFDAQIEVTKPANFLLGAVYQDGSGQERARNVTHTRPEETLRPAAAANFQISVAAEREAANRAKTEEARQNGVDRWGSVRSGAAGWSYALSSVDNRLYAMNGGQIRVYNPELNSWHIVSSEVIPAQLRSR